MRDLHNNIAPRPGLSPVAATTDNTAYVSTVVDLLGYGSCEFIILTGTNTDTNATFSVLFEDGDLANLSDHAAVADEFLLGTESQASFTFADDNKLFKIGYTGSKRYARVTITPAGNDSGNVYLAGVWLLGHPRSVPTANPPA